MAGSQKEHLRAVSEIRHSPDSELDLAQEGVAVDDTTTLQEQHLEFLGTPLIHNRLTPDQIKSLCRINEKLKKMNVGLLVRVGRSGLYATLNAAELVDCNQDVFMDEVAALLDLRMPTHVYNGTNSRWEELISDTVDSDSGNDFEDLDSQPDSQGDYAVYSDAGEAGDLTKATDEKYQYDSASILACLEYAANRQQLHTIPAQPGGVPVTTPKRVSFKSTPADAELSRIDINVTKRGASAPSRRTCNTALDYIAPAPVTSHFLFLSAFQQLPTHKQGAIIYMLGFALLVIAIGGTSLIGAGVATTASVVGYAGVSMMLTGAGMMFFNAPKHAPSEKPPVQTLSCCV